MTTQHKTKSKIRPKWLRFTEETNALDYLERAGEFIKLTESDKTAWKWVVLALHGALYGFAIAACKGSDYRSVVHVTKKGLNKLISFDQALAMCADAKRMGTLHGGRALILTDGQKTSIMKLKQSLRNNFEHYVPGGWSIELHGLPRISIDVLDIIHFLALETFRYQHLTQSQRRRVKSITYQCKRLLKKSALYRDAVKSGLEVTL